MCRCAQGHGCTITLTIAKFPGSDFAAIQFLDRPFEELGIIEAEAGTQDGNLFGRLLVKVAAYMLKPDPARRWRGDNRCDLGLSAVTFDLAITSPDFS